MNHINNSGKIIKFRNEKTHKNIGLFNLHNFRISLKKIFDK